MKIALLGSAPSSIGLAPYGDPSWAEIWGCSPGAYFRARRVTAWFEIHRWEPPVLGVPDQQKTWFSPEYVGWLYKQPRVWMFDPPPDMACARMIPSDDLRKKYGDYFFTSSLAWMFAMAIETILELRRQGTSTGEDAIGLWGVDMAAASEYGNQRLGCQFFAQIADFLGIRVQVPLESDLLTPAPLYGLCELSHFQVKSTARMEEMQGRLDHAEQRRKQAEDEAFFLKGGIDDLQYQLNNWNFDGTPNLADFGRIFSADNQPKEEPEPEQ